ncbi:MAG: hypothetical protein PF690_08815 [Deltaproteobacteria bacterium]|jgi:hypothetical protein|nr:hypothetical protein [Deltaproteobacteria bacterium]
MRFFELLNTQHVIALIIVAIIFLILFGVALAFIPTSGPISRVLKIKPIQHFADNIEKADGPFPLIITLLIAGTFLWALYYILFYGFSEVIL